MKYTCEFCKKSYDNETDCTQCEQKHKMEQLEEEALMQKIEDKKAELDQKKKEYDAINKEYLDLWDKYYEKHTVHNVWTPVIKNSIFDLFFND